MTTNENVTVSIEADTSAFDKALDDLQKKSSQFGNSLTTALKSAAVSGHTLEDVLRGLATNLAGLALDTGLKPLKGLMSSLFSGILGNFRGVTPFAKGGVVSSPTYFGMGGGSLGLTGEAGAEAILPLERGADGRLGVASRDSRRSPQIIFNVSTPDVASFRKSEAQLSSMLARAVRHGTRSL